MNPQQGWQWWPKGVNVWNATQRKHTQAIALQVPRGLRMPTAGDRPGKMHSLIQAEFSAVTLPKLQVWKPSSLLLLCDCFPAYSQGRKPTSQRVPGDSEHPLCVYFRSAWLSRRISNSYCLVTVTEQRVISLTATAQRSGVRTQSAARKDAVWKEPAMHQEQQSWRTGPALTNTKATDKRRQLTRLTPFCFPLHKNVPSWSNA